MDAKNLPLSFLQFT